MAKRAVIYARVSLDSSGEGQAVARQITSCQALAQARGWTVVGVEEDNSISALGRRKRPAWERVLGMVERGEVDVVLAWAVDRLTRSLVELERLIVTAEDKNIAIATVTGDIDLTTDTGRMVARILATVARAEVERKGARQRAANAQRAERGSIAWSRRPFGFEKDGTHREPEAQALRRAYADVLLGKPRNAIAREWNTAGLLSSLGKEWRPGTIRQILLAARNAGIRSHNGVEVAEGEWEPIVDLHTFRAVEKVVRRKDGAPGGRGKHLLRGLLHCGVCGGTLNRTMRNGYAIYACTYKGHGKTGKGGCQTHRAEWLEEFVQENVRLALRSNVGQRLWAGEDKSADVEEARRDLAVVEGKLSEAAEDYALDLMTREQFLAATERLRKRKADLEGLIASVRPAGAVLALVGAPEDVADGWGGLGDDARRAVIDILVEDIVCQPRGKLWPGNPESVYQPDKIDVRWRATGT